LLLLLPLLLLLLLLLLHASTCHQRHCMEPCPSV
jgi:hypothetical protein